MTRRSAILVVFQCWTIRDLPGAEQHPYAAKPEDAQMRRSSAIVEQVTLERASDGVSKIVLKGTLPTGCHQLRLTVPEKADRQRRIEIQAWSVVEKGRVCPQMLQNFTAVIPIKKLKKGRYVAVVNDQEPVKVEYR